MQNLSNEELNAKLVEILQTGPLYTELKYAGLSCWFCLGRSDYFALDVEPSRLGRLAPRNLLKLTTTRLVWRSNVTVARTAISATSLIFTDGNSPKKT